MHRDSVAACALVIDQSTGEVIRAKDRFGTTVHELGRLAQWLADHGVTTVGMEATGVYWKPVYYVLEDLFEEVMVCNAAHVRNVPGRKSDLADCEWLADVIAHGMVRPSFVPPAPVRELRDLTRYRRSQIDERAREIQRLEKVLQDAGIKLTSVAARVLSQSSRDMLGALIAGERDPARLADMARGRMRPKRDRLVEAFAGIRFGPHHAVMARHILGHIDFLDAAIDALSAEVHARLDPFLRAVDLLCTIPGISQATAEVFVAETGADMAKFPTADCLAAWAGLAPANHESAGKRRPAGTRHGGRWLRHALIEAAKSVSRSQGCYLGAQYRRLAARRGPNKATVAVAHSMVVAAWHMLINDQPYDDPGPEFFGRHDATRETARLVRRLEALGHQVSLSPAA